MPSKVDQEDMIDLLTVLHAKPQEERRQSVEDAFASMQKMMKGVKKWRKSKMKWRLESRSIQLKPLIPCKPYARQFQLTRIPESNGNLP